MKSVGESIRDYKFQKKVRDYILKKKRVWFGNKWVGKILVKEWRVEVKIEYSTLLYLTIL